MELDFKMKSSQIQTQKMILTPKMQQYIKMLQMPAGALREYMYSEYEINPVIEIKDKSILQEEKDEQGQTIDKENFIKYLAEDSYGDRNEKIINTGAENETSIFNFISQEISLKEYLYEQLAAEKINKDIFKTAAYIIECLDSRGYLAVTVSEIAEELEISKEKAEEALSVVQSLEPYGIGASDIKECLLIQCSKLNMLDSRMETIITEYLDYVAKNRFEYIAKKLKISPREAQRYADRIKKLEPKPSRGFYTGDEVNYIVPDAEIKNMDGKFYILMNDKVLPKLSINKMYKNQVKYETDKETAKYIKDNLNKAVNLITAVNERNNTVYKVIEYLTEKQQGFFLNGKKDLKPLTIKEAAKNLGISESTVSRAVKDKYVLTSFGTVKLKDLFPSGVKVNNKENSENSSEKEQGSEDIAVLKIKNRIKEIIFNENKAKPLSDQAISDALKQEKIKISRRTVTKYRESMNIKSSALRKRI